MLAEKLSSISEYDENSTRTSLTGLSSYTGYTVHNRSPSGDSLNTISSTITNNTNKYSRNGLPGDRKIATENALQQRLRTKSLAQTHNYQFCKKIRITMALIGILLLVAAIFMLSFYLPKQYESETIATKAKIIEKKYTVFGKNIFIDHKDYLTLRFSSNVSALVAESESKPNIALKVDLGQQLSEAARKNFSVHYTNDSLTMKFQELDLDVITLTITKLNFSDQCYEVYWISSYNNKLEDCFDTKFSHWFGLGEVFNQTWPLDKTSFPMTPFLTSDYLDSYQPNIFGSVLEPFAVNSKGAGIYIDEHVPLHVSMNEVTKKHPKGDKFCIRADLKDYYNVKYVNTSSTNLLKYTVCIRDNIKDVHKVMFDKFIEKPEKVPDKRMMTQPIWSTWVQFRTHINQSVILKFAEEIKNHGFERSHIQIDDSYSTQYGDFNFNPAKFSDPNLMIDILKSYGFRITVWVYPFAGLKSKAFLRGLPYWMKFGKKGAPGITKWWHGFATILDTTNENARTWFQNTLEGFKRLKIDGFKFDAGELNYLPQDYNFATPQPNPNYFTKLYVELASKFQQLGEVRSSYKCQKYGMFTRILDRASHWDTGNGLHSVLTAALTFSMIGYPYVLPDMVGGNEYFYKPNKELYVRWAQLSAFLPAIQFSKPPWDFDNDKDVLVIVKEALAIRKNISEVMYTAAENAVITGEPIIRPLWWYWPVDHETFVVDTEFMLTEKFLVAPVMHLNIVWHTIYLPAGVWKEQWGEKSTINMTKGGYRGYNVTLRDVCYFELLSKN